MTSSGPLNEYKAFNMKSIRRNHFHFRCIAGTWAGQTQAMESCFPLKCRHVAQAPPCIHQNASVSFSAARCSEHFQSLFFSTLTQWQDKRAAAPCGAKRTGFLRVHNEWMNKRFVHVSLFSVPSICLVSLFRTCVKKRVSAQLTFLVIYSESSIWSALSSLNVLENASKLVYSHLWLVERLALKNNHSFFFELISSLFPIETNGCKFHCRSTKSHFSFKYFPSFCVQPDPSNP